MYLTLVQLAESLGAEPKVVEGWIRDKDLPCFMDRGRLLFDRAEVVTWAARRGLASRAGFLAPQKPHVLPSRRLEPMLRAGGIWRDVPATSVLEQLETVVAKLPGASAPVLQVLVQRVRAPNGISWAPVGNGLALPHLRTPVALGRDAGIFALLFLREALPLAGTGPDGLPVTRLLFFIAPSPRAHLELLGQLSNALLRGRLRQFVLEGGSDDEILNALDEPQAANDTGIEEETQR
jgi:PTS system nitrogen regulatory IIA component